jgi:hypothetical protein
MCEMTASRLTQLHVTVQATAAAAAALVLTE